MGGRAVGSRKARLLLGLAAAISAAACFALAEARSAEANQAEKIFESLYGDQVRAAQATREPDDDLALAAKLLGAAAIPPE